MLAGFYTFIVDQLRNFVRKAARKRENIYMYELRANFFFKKNLTSKPRKTKDAIEPIA